MKRVLVTGGAGFIGSHVVEHLLQKGCDVAVIDNLKNGRREFIPKITDKNLYAVDICDRQATDQAIKASNPDTVIHLAAIHFIPYCDQHPLEAMRINIMGSRHIIESLAELKQLQCCFFASTAAVYPVSDKSHLESDMVAPIDIYGITKVAGEVLFQEFSQRCKLPVAVGRLFNAVGPHETNPHLLPDILKQLLAGKESIELGNLTPKRDFIDARDMAKAIVALVERPPKQFDIFNIGAAKQYSVVEVVGICEKSCAVKSLSLNPSALNDALNVNTSWHRSIRLKNKTGWQPSIPLETTLRDLLSVS